MSTFAHLLPEPDLQPTATTLWQMADRLSLCEGADLEAHKASIMEAQEKLSIALAKIGGAS